MARHYLDHASTSPPRPEVLDAMIASLRGAVGPGIATGDPGRIHTEGMQARAIVEDAREQVAHFFGARSREVVFTSGATESIAAATWGAAERGTEMITPAVEHSAVRESVAALVASGTHRSIVIGVDEKGHVEPDEIIEQLSDDTALVHLQQANHEVGTRHALEPVVAACRERNILIHIDAACAAGHDPIAFDELGADLLSVSAHKFGGPPGIGALLIRRGLRLRQLLRGGDQERARRAGLENVPAIVGFAAACRALGTDDRLAEEAAQSRRLTDRVVVAAPKLDGVRVYGDPVDRVPHLVCLGIDGIEPQAVLLGLDQAGIAAHSGSACSSEALEPSPVLEAMNVDAQRSLRISTGWNTKEEDVDKLLETLPNIIANLRSLAT